MFKNIITISGKAGCGKSTIADLLSEKLDYKIISSGDEMRKLAKKYNMEISDFVVNYLPKHKEVDYELDNNFLNICKKSNNIIVPTRIMSQILNNNNIEHFKVFLFASKAIRISRILEREKLSINKIEKDLKERDSLDIKRYKEIYNIDTSDLSVYNLILYTHFTNKNIGKVKLKIKYGNSFSTKYIAVKDTLPSTLTKIIINEYNEYVRRNKKR